ncbi:MULTISPECIES: type II toxin-antitoxin system HipA family toxin [unclassified Lysobacter]|uniref:type II toxin-antitoxin system HipA family toxin n=1 Tax=unclassified Lysobacter TaxID=2635362 RepID=UPI0006F317B7|nr:MULTISPECIES: type II toxin-antitoxin system HipA family toxin [unclassified Lysobacter]KRA16216.1 phosphatidylinositol kinase [Lysobacter sp. Root604]KRD75785.1 phosphatidylinositol kinase [Lysobacter sp. Root983]
MNAAPLVVVEVRVWGKRVGAVAADPTYASYAFEYDPAWARRGIQLAPLTMPTPGPGIHTFPSLDREAYKGLPGLLADALPDDFGNQLIDAWMASHGVAKQDVTTLDRLAYMGKRGMGAIEFRPARGSARESKKPLAMKSLVEEARRAIHADLSDDEAAQAALANIIRVGTSAGGARAKAVIAWHPQTNEIRSGQFDVDPGWEHWLLKFDGVGKDLELGSSQDYGRIEYAYYLMATHAGIVMSPCRLLQENGRRHFMTKRFDREGNDKVHVQTLCALQHLNYKQRGTHAYEQLFMVATQLGLAPEALTQLFARMTFNVVAKNHDDHTKNHAFMLREGGAWEPTPAYDVTFAYNPSGEWTQQHLMSINGKFDAITKEDLLNVAARFSIPNAEKAISRVCEAVREWSGFAAEAGVQDAEIARIGQLHIARL